MACIATWSFGLQAVQVAAKELRNGASCIDAVEKAINDVEDDPSTGPYYVGRGCYPNSEGLVQLDAAVMRGSDCGFGAVAALEGYPKPISVARCVLEKASASMLVGKGATDFARAMNFKMESNDDLLSDKTRKAFEEYTASGTKVPKTGHDTIGEHHISADTMSWLLCLDQAGSLAAGVSTSGPPFKLPGRVGDSPLPGCGLYADDEAGAAAASGDGEKIMKFCPSYQIVQLLKQGVSPQKACDHILETMQRQQQFEVAIVALNKLGEVGAASSVREWTDFRDSKTYLGFPYAVYNTGCAPAIHVYC